MTRWAVLAPYLVRLAGFAFERLDGLRCTRAAEAEAALVAATVARESAGTALDAALAAERYATNPAFDDPATRKVLSKQVKQVRAFAKRVVDEDLPAAALDEVVRVVPAVKAAAEALVLAHAGWRAARAAYAEAFAADFERARGAMRALYGDARLQESVFLESVEAHERIVQLVETAGPRNSRARQRERLAALYAQRFCAKNDTNSICGPHGVAYLDAPAVAASPQIEIVTEDARRETYFSFWGAERLLEVAAEAAGEAARTTYGLHPSAHVRGEALSWCVMEHDATSTFRRRYRTTTLPEAGVRLVEALAAPRTLAELAPLAAELELDGDELVAYLGQLVDAGAVMRGPTLPPGLFDPLAAVRAELARWPESEAQTWALGELDALAGDVRAFATANLDERIAIARGLRARFVEATGDAATRGEGRHYADRSLLHEDCYVDVRTDLGPARATIEQVLPPLFAVLELPLELARERMREWFRARFGEGVRVPALEVHRAFDDDQVLATPAATPRAAALRTAIERVQDAIARAAVDGGPIALGVDALVGACAELPPPSHPAYISVDVMLRREPDRVSLVLGEVHGFFWLPTSLLDVLPPDHRERTVADMRAAVATMADGVTTAECVFLHTQATDRRFPLATTDLRLMTASNRPGAVDLGALELQLVGDTFEYTRDGVEVVPMVAYTNYPFVLYTSRIAPVFDSYAERFFPDSLLPASLREGDAARITIGDVVVRRRSWRRPVSELRLALAASDEAELLRRGLALQRALGCGTHVFVSMGNEPKPVMLDFANVFLLEALVNMLEREPADGAVRFGEMMPGPGELVARGPDGARTCELRMGFYRVTAPTAGRE